MLFLIDGYNVTMADPATKDLGKEAMRETLLGRLSARADMLLGAGDVVVVFDARDQVGASAETRGRIKVVYAADADTEIVRRAAAARQVTIVSNDMRLRARTSQDVGRRVGYRDASTCFESASGRRPKRARVDRDQGLPRDADAITKELEELWDRNEE